MTPENKPLVCTQNKLLKKIVKIKLTTVQQSLNFSGSAKIRAASVHACFVYYHAHVDGWFAAQIWQNRGNQIECPSDFLQFTPSACGRSLSNQDNFEELGLAVLGKGALFTVRKLEHYNRQA